MPECDILKGTGILTSGDIYAYSFFKNSGDIRNDGNRVCSKLNRHTSGRVQEVPVEPASVHNFAMHDNRLYDLTDARCPYL